MKSLKITDHKKAREIVEKKQPLIIQRVNSHWDFLCDINSPPDIRKDHPWEFNRRPPLFYSIKEDDNYYYLTTAFYHRYDPKARHEHDFEGVLFRLHKTGGIIIDPVVTVSHWNLLTWSYDRIITIKENSHAIIAEQRMDITRNQMLYRDFSYRNMDNPKEFDKEKARKLFKGTVHLPDEWIDMKVENYVKRKKPVIKGEHITYSSGLWENRPDILIELLLAVKKINGG